MINCKNCKKEIRQNAKFCPYCGIDIKKGENYSSCSISFKFKSKDIIVIIILSIFSLSILLRLKQMLELSNKETYNIYYIVHLLMYFLSLLGICVNYKTKSSNSYLLSGICIVLSVIFGAFYSYYWQTINDEFDILKFLLYDLIPNYTPIILMYVLVKKEKI